MVNQKEVIERLHEDFSLIVVTVDFMKNINEESDNKECFKIF